MVFVKKKNAMVIHFRVIVFKKVETTFGIASGFEALIFCSHVLNTELKAIESTNRLTLKKSLIESGTNS